MKTRRASNNSKGLLAGAGVGLFIGLLLGLTPGYAQVAGDSDQVIGEPVVGVMGITETVEEIMARDALLSKQVGPPRPSGDLRKYYPDQSNLPQDPYALPYSQYPPAAQEVGEQQGGHQGTPRLPQGIGTSFVGATFGESYQYPPDTQGAVGPTQIGLALNGRVKFWNKAGTSVSFSTTLDNFFQSVAGGYPTCDPRVRFDRTSNRWFITAMNLPTNNMNNRILIAVSSGSSVGGTSSFTFFYFVFSQGGGTVDVNCFADFPSQAVDVNAVYVGVNVFNSALTQFLGSSAFVIKKSSLLSGGPIYYTAFRRIVNGSSQGPVSPSGVDNWDPNAYEGYFVGMDNALFGRVTIRRITDPGGDYPSISGNIPVSVLTTANPMHPPALGSTYPIDGNDRRHFHAMMHRNRLTGETTMWMSHNVRCDQSGQAAANGDRNGGRWYEIQNMTGTPTMRQGGTVFDSAATNPANYIYPSVAMSGQGHMAIGTTVCGNLQRLEIAVAGRLYSDPLGTTQTPTIAQTSSTNYNQGLQNGRYRWGDYSFMGVDPSDDQTIWTAQEYCDNTDSWAIRCIKLIAPPPATPISCNPPTVQQGAQNVTVVITGQSIDGSGFYDTDPSYTNRMSVSISGSGVVATSQTWDSPTQVTMKVNVSATAALTSRYVTVVNPDGQYRASATGILTVVEAADCVGDCNCDGLINFSDINPFVAVLGGATPCNFANCDINGDGQINFSDINPFVALLSSGAECP